MSERCHGAPEGVTPPGALAKSSWDQHFCDPFAINLDALESPGPLLFRTPKFLKNTELGVSLILKLSWFEKVRKVGQNLN